METIGGGFGLSETLNSDLTSSSTPNNIDIHMEKNTEYGAMAIMSASSYGNPNKINDGETTTGNETGIVININKEWVAAGTIGEASTYYYANSKYKNVETYEYVKRNGDAIGETAGWHGSGASQWIYGSYSRYLDTGIANAKAGLLRAYSGSIFSYFGNAGSQYQATFTPQDAYYAYGHPSRCVVVVGEGI